VIIFLLSSTEGFGLKFPNPSPSLSDWPGKQRLSVTSELITFETLVARQTLEHFEFNFSYVCREFGLNHQQNFAADHI